MSFYLLSKIIISLILLLLKIVLILVAIAFFTLADRKLMASIQRRLGPNIVGIWGLLQPIADGVKALFKQQVIPRKANQFLFFAAPALTLVLSLWPWSIFPFGLSTLTSDVELGLLVLLAISSLGVYGIILSGWASNSKYAFLGGLRSSAQMISYEVALGLSIMPVILASKSLNLTEIVLSQSKCWFVITLFPAAIIFFISALAETNRTPFDLPEAEAELVAGYNVEYSGIVFAMFFLAEYSNMLAMSCFSTILFWGGWLKPTFLLMCPHILAFGLKIFLHTFLFVLVRAILPRYRYDQLMDIGWKLFLPLTLAFFIFILKIIYLF